ncbi:MAG: cytochrome c [Gammaproteobacteria bacterium]|nr:cytochrome c [Gammaproteobacteria bacterium]
MRKGEKGIFIAMLVSVVILAAIKFAKESQETEPDPGIPFYTTADKNLTSEAARIMKDGKCKSCHSLWGTRELTQAVPAPPLDGMGYFRDEKWLYEYFSAENPQDILPSRLKPEYRHPSFATYQETDRISLAKYIASLQVEEWYLEETKKRRYEKLTGLDYNENVK